MGLDKYLGPISNENIEALEIRGPYLNLHAIEHGDFSAKKEFDHFFTLPKFVMEYLAFTVIFTSL